MRIKEQLKEQERKKKRLRIVLGLVLAIAILAATAAILITQVYTVKKVDVIGNELYSDEQIEQVVMSDEYSWSTLYTYLKYRFLRQEKLPFIDSLKVSMKFTDPHVIRVEVYEKGILGYLYISSIDQNAYFDKDGFVVETSQEQIKNVPQIEGLSCESVVLYEELPLEDTAALKNLLSLTQLLEKYEIPSKKIVYDQIEKNMTVFSGKIEIRVGNADNLSQKIMRLPYILPKLKGKKGVLHLENWTSETTDIVFDPKKTKQKK